MNVPPKPVFVHRCYFCEKESATYEPTKLPSGWNYVIYKNLPKLRCKGCRHGA